MIRGGQTGRVFRAVHGRDAHGDAVDAAGNVIRLEKDGTAFVGEVKGLIMGGLSASPSMARQETSDSSGQIGVPNRNVLKVQFGDRLVVNGVRYRVTSRPRWDYDNSLSLSKPEYHWVSVVGVEDQ